MLLNGNKVAAVAAIFAAYDENACVPRQEESTTVAPADFEPLLGLLVPGMKLP